MSEFEPYIDNGGTEKSVLAANGYHADGRQVAKELLTRIRMYSYQHSKQMDIESLAQLSSIVLYSHRFFPYYTFNILGGIDANGCGAVYSFDPVGSFERESYRAGGSGASLIQPFLDCQIGQKNSSIPDLQPLTVEKALKLTKDAFSAAAERDIHTGDYIQIFIIKREGVRVETFDLRKD